MGTHVIKMPDVGEGVAEAELVEWQVKPGDLVREDDIVAAVMTDKATVEIPTGVSGKVIRLAGEVGDQIAVGAELLQIEIEGEGNYTGEPGSGTGSDQPHGADDAAMDAPAVNGHSSERNDKPNVAGPEPAASGAGGQGRTAATDRVLSGPHVANGRPVAAPSVRRRAREMGIDLRRVPGSGPAGRIVHGDLDDYAEGRVAPPPSSGLRRKTSVEDIKILGLRRKIAERMAEAKRHIPHITIIEEVDVSALEELRQRLNKDHAATRGKLTVLPFIMRAIVRAVAEQPAFNAHFLDDENLVRQFGAVDIGIATQTASGLMVPVVRHAEALGLWDAAAEIVRLAEAARDGTAQRDELSGSTISISSLGPLGALATTPIINRPEVAIVGINKMTRRPVWIDGEFEPRQMMNISCSFDHRVIDGWDAAVFVQRLKVLLEGPAVMFVEG